MDSAVRFHPGQTTSKIKISDAAEAFETEGPSKGNWKSYRRMEANNYQERGAFYNPNPKYPAAKYPPKARAKSPKRVVAAFALDPPAVAGDALERIGGQASGSEELPPPPPPGIPPLRTVVPPPPPASEFDLVD